MHRINDIESDLSAGHLRNILDYNPLNGEFRWKIAPISTVRVGQIAGRLTRLKYRQISIKRKRYYAHRLAWLYVNGEWPAAILDHINQNRDDNRIDNIRESTSSKNGYNQGRHRNNKSGFKGVYLRKASQKWSAQIKVNTKSIFLGVFSTPEEASNAYAAASKKYHGKFSRTIGEKSYA